MINLRPENGVLFLQPCRLLGDRFLPALPLVAGLLRGQVVPLAAFKVPGI